jgi:flagellar hook assembly protein FlgD
LSFSLRPGSPNPFHQATRLTFELPTAEPVRLVIYDAAGRIVSVLAEENYAPGIHRLGWDGRNSAGRRVTSGVYFARIDAGPYSATRRLMFTR